jgi:flagellar operon protein
VINKIGQPQQKINSNINQRLNANLDFSKVLEQVQSKADLKISAHALDRLKERNISLTDKDISTLKTAIENIRSKGGREALILYKNVAYITSVKNNTIITAVDSESLKENVFTNIDSAVIV